MTKLNLSFESNGEDLRLQTTLQYARMIFEYLLNVSTPTPIVVDGDNLVWRTDDLKEKLCKALDLDSERVCDSWEPTPKDERPVNQYIWEFTKVAHESTGIQRVDTKPKVPGVEEALEKWSRDYGNDVASDLRSLLETELIH